MSLLPESLSCRGVEGRVGVVHGRHATCVGGHEHLFPEACTQRVKWLRKAQLAVTGVVVTATEF